MTELFMRFLYEIMTVRVLWVVILSTLMIPAFAHAEDVYNLSINANYFDGSEIVFDSCILYNKQWQEPQQSYTETNGCEFANLPSAIYNIEIYDDGFWLGNYRDLNLTNDLEITIETTILGALLFSVFYEDNRTPFPDATVELYNHDNRLLQTAKTNHDGKASFSNLWPNLQRGENYWTQISFGSDLIETISEINVDGEKSHTQYVIMEKKRPTTGSIIDPDSELTPVFYPVLGIGISLMFSSILFSQSVRHRIIVSSEIKNRKLIRISTTLTSIGATSTCFIMSHSTTFLPEWLQSQ